MAQLSNFDSKYVYYASKEAFLRDLLDLVRYGNPPDMEMVYRLGNTDTDDWSSGGSDDHDSYIDE